MSSALAAGRHYFARVDEQHVACVFDAAHAIAEAVYDGIELSSPQRDQPAAALRLAEAAGYELLSAP
jgi:hypothetical protein